MRVLLLRCRLGPPQMAWEAHASPLPDPSIADFVQHAFVTQAASGSGAPRCASTVYGTFVHREERPEVRCMQAMGLHTCPLNFCRRCAPRCPQAQTR